MAINRHSAEIISQTRLIWSISNWSVRSKIGGTSTYYVGDDSRYGYVYIPMTSEDPGAITALEAGKRYVYNIAMRDNVGFKNDGDPILKPILFDVYAVDTWDEVTVNITL